MKLRESDEWIGGYFGRDSYAAGHGEQPQDLLLERAYVIHNDGLFAEEEGQYIEIGSQLIVDFARVEYLEFFPGKEVRSG